jgi:hypothetical protein
MVEPLLVVWGPEPRRGDGPDTPMPSHCLLRHLSFLSRREPVPQCVKDVLTMQPLRGLPHSRPTWNALLEGLDLR